MKTRVWILGAAIALAAGLAPRATAAEPGAGTAKSQGPYVVVVGVGEFKDAAIKPRPTADADAKALHAMLADPKFLGVPADRAKLLLSADATRDAVVKAVDAAAAATGPDDLLLVAFFGRGTSAADKPCFLTSDSTVKDRAKTALLVSDLEPAFKKVKGNRVKYKKTTFKIVGPANYAKLFKAAYAGIKSGNPSSKVAIGETSARGRDKPLAGVSASVAPGTFAKYLAKVPGLKFDAWAHHPYPTSPNLPPTQRVRYPNVTLSTLPAFEKSLKTLFHRSVPVWITEYGHETKPPDPHGVSYALQAKYAVQALTIAKNDPNVQMFIWFVFHDSAGNPWQSGLYGSHDDQKPAYDPFGALARLVDGTMSTITAGSAPRVTMYMPYLAYYSQPGAEIGLTYVVRDGSNTVAVGQPVAALAGDQSITFTPAFTPAKGKTYTVTATANEPNGHSEIRTALIKVS